MFLGEYACVRRSTGEEDWLDWTPFIVVVVLTGVSAIVEIPLKSFHLGFEFFNLNFGVLTFLVYLRQQVDVQEANARYTKTPETAVIFQNEVRAPAPMMKRGVRILSRYPNPN